MRWKKVGIVVLTLLLLFLAYWIIVAAAQIGLPFIAYGWVKDASGAAVPGATVKVYGFMGFPFTPVTTNSEGFYQANIQVLPPGPGQPIAAAADNLTHHGWGLYLVGLESSHLLNITVYPLGWNRTIVTTVSTTKTETSTSPITLTTPLTQTNTATSVATIVARELWIRTTTTTTFTTTTTLRTTVATVTSTIQVTYTQYVETSTTITTTMTVP